MKIQFCREYSTEIVAEFDVEAAPTKEQIEAIEEYIFEAKEQWEEENDGDFTDFDYWEVCCDAVVKYLKIVKNEVVKTFYI